MSHKCISHDAEAALRAAFRGMDELESAPLLDALETNYSTKRACARSLICRANATGLLTRTYRHRPFRYRLNPGWVNPSRAPARPRVVAPGKEHHPAVDVAYTGRAINNAPLVPSLGRPCNTVRQEIGDPSPIQAERNFHAQ